MVYQRNCANHVQKGEEYYKIPFIAAGITFFAGIVNRRALSIKSLWLTTGLRITYVESALYGEAKTSVPRKWSNLSLPRGRSTSQRKSPSVRLDLLLPRIIRLHYSAVHNFKKLEPFIKLCGPRVGVSENV